MNIKEAIEKVKNAVAFSLNDILTEQKVDVVYKSEVLDIINQIDKPQKVVISKFVAEWYEKNKEGLWETVIDLIRSDERNQYLQANPVDISDEDATFCDWLFREDDSLEILVSVHKFGYEVEQEQLYVVEIAEAILTKITRGNNVQYKFLNFADVSDVFEKTIYTTRLTEREIKQKDERLWQFAKEVE